MDGPAAFLREYILGRTLYTDELTYSLEGGALEGVYSDQMTFSHCRRTEHGLGFDLFVVAREKLYRCENGKRGELRKDFSGASLFRYELARRQSSGMITGFMRYVSSSLPAPVPAEALAAAVWDFGLRDGGLSWQEREILYRDQPAPDGGFRAVSFEARCRFFCEAGKARYEYDGACFDVDPGDFSRTPSQAVFPKFVARER